jgi:hypothetical protein
VEKLSKKRPQTHSTLPPKCLVTPFGWGMENAWASSQRLPVYVLNESDKSFYLYPNWSKPVATAEFFESYYGRPLTPLGECVTLERK